jgi:hypothetical protein
MQYRPGTSDAAPGTRSKRHANLNGWHRLIEFRWLGARGAADTLSADTIAGQSDELKRVRETELGSLIGGPKLLPASDP